MLTNPSTVLARLSTYPTLASYAPAKWVRSVITNPAVTLWHPFFQEDDTRAPQIMAMLDAAIRHLLDEKIVGTAERARGLCAKTRDGFWASLTELVLAVRLHQGYPLEFLSIKGARAPDLRLETASGPVYVEITALHKTWDFHAVSEYLFAALGSTQHGYRIGVTCWSDGVKLADEILEELAERVRAYIAREPFPRGAGVTEVFASADRRVRVDLRPSPSGVAYVATGTVGGASPGPVARFGQIMTRLTEKADQVRAYRPSVVVLELANYYADFAPLGAIDAVWHAYGAAFRRQDMPPEVDLAVLSWQSITGEAWGAARPLANPISQWAASREAEDICFRWLASPSCG